MTIVLHLLGEVTLTRAAAPVPRLLAAPKRLGLLTYLTLAEPAGFRRRDELAALFWPDLARDDARAFAHGAALAGRASWFMVGFWLGHARRLRERPAFPRLLARIGLHAPAAQPGLAAH